MSSQKTLFVVMLQLLFPILISPNTVTNPFSNKSNVFKRDWSKFDHKNFITDCFNIDWHNLLSQNDENVPLSTNFLHAINSLLNKYEPF